MGQAAPPNRLVEQNPALIPLPPEEAMKHIKLPAGFRLQLVLSEPQIREPVAVAWDGNGRMFVAEMRGYMQDIDGTGAQDPVGRISLHEDTDGDGRMDKHTVYLDGLIEPRTILPVDDGLLIGEPPDLWYCRDLDGDGIADSRKKSLRQILHALQQRRAQGQWLAVGDRQLDSCFPARPTISIDQP